MRDEQAGDGRLAGAGIADEHEVTAAFGDREVVAAAQLLDAREVHEQPHLALHVRRGR